MSEEEEDEGDEDDGVAECLKLVLVFFNPVSFIGLLVLIHCRKMQIKFVLF